MGLTVSNQASYYYKVYEYQNTESFSENKVDEAAVLKDSYNISSIASAFDSIDKTISTDFYAIGNVTSYAKNSMKLSQSDYFDKLFKYSENTMTDLLKNNNDMSGIYSRLTALSTVNEDYFEYYSSDSEESDTEEKSAISKYSNYLSEDKTEGLLDILA